MPSPESPAKRITADSRTSRFRAVVVASAVAMVALHLAAPEATLGLRLSQQLPIIASGPEAPSGWVEMTSDRGVLAETPAFEDEALAVDVPDAGGDRELPAEHVGLELGTGRARDRAGDGETERGLVERRGRRTRVGVEQGRGLGAQPSVLDL